MLFLALNSNADSSGRGSRLCQPSPVPALAGPPRAARSTLSMSPQCYFIATSQPDAAVSQQFFALATALATRGHRVVLLVDGQHKELENSDANPTIRTWPSKRPVHVRDALFLGRLIRQHHPDCLISNFGAVTLMLSVGWLLRVPHRIAWYHTLSTQIKLDSKLPRWKWWLLKLRKRSTYSLATCLVPVSEAASRDLQNTYGVPSTRCRVCLNSLRDPGLAYSVQPVRQAARVICVGRLDRCKGQDVLIRAVALLKESVPSLHVELVGSGPLSTDYRQLTCELRAEDEILFVPNIPHSEIHARLTGACVSVVPSRSDAFCLVVIESLAAGIPIVASRTGGIPELFRDGVDGLLVPPDDPGALAGALSSLLSNPELRERMGKNARGQFLACFEQSKVIAELAEWLQSLVAFNGNVRPPERRGESSRDA